MAKDQPLKMYTAKIEIVDIQAVNKNEARKELNNYIRNMNDVHNLVTIQCQH